MSLCADDHTHSMEWQPSSQILSSLTYFTHVILSVQLRLTYAQELKTRTEMEMLLRKCVDDVRQDIAEMYVCG